MITGASRLKVLHIVGKLEYGGVSAWLKNYHDPSVRMHIVESYRKNRGELAAEFEATGYVTHHLPFSWNLWQYIKAMRTLLREGGYQVVHDHRSFVGGIALWVAARERVPVRILFHHAPNDDRRAGVLRKAFERFLRFLAVRYATDIWACGHYMAMDGGMIPGNVLYVPLSAQSCRPAITERRFGRPWGPLKMFRSWGLSAA